MGDIKIQSIAVKKRIGMFGGNRKPQTFRNCKKCGEKFGPLARLKQQFCSKECAYLSRKRKRKTVTLKIAINAQRTVRYHIEKGSLVRPKKCEECGTEKKKIEAAHFDYKKSTKVRWLCRHCHIIWDKKEPKHGTISVKI